MEKKFTQLQTHLAKHPELVAEHTTTARTLVYVAGMSLDPEELMKINGIECYEERFLYVIGLLRDPKTTIIFISSLQINQDVIDYYFTLFSRNAKERSSMLRRWHPVYVGNSGTHNTLTQKILASKRMQRDIATHIQNKQKAVLRCFNSSPDEQALAVKLAIPLYAPHPKHLPLGSKSGARTIFKAAGLNPAYGVEHVATMKELVKAIWDIKQHHKRARSVVVKFDYSFSGVGNANLNIEKFPATQSAAQRYIEKNLTPCEAELSNKQYLKKLFQLGGIVEQWIEATKVYSPSVQVAITPDGKTNIISTHEQLVDEETHQVYLGARFPARKSLRPPIIKQAKAIAQQLANDGVIGLFSIDFIVTKHNSTVHTYPIEINLRKGGTTHPFQIARMLTEGTYHTNGIMRATNTNMRVYYYAFDNIKSKRYIGLHPRDIIKMVREAGLEFDPETNIGVTLHLLGAVHAYGKFGAVCIARSPRAAEQLFILLNRVLEVNADKRLDKHTQHGQLESSKETDSVHVNRDRLVETFITLVKIPSPSYQEEAVRNWLRKKLEQLNVRVTIDKHGNIIAKKPGQSSRQSSRQSTGKQHSPLLLSSHMDTVQPCHNVQPVIRGDVIMTDGTTILGADNKAGIVYILETLQLIKEYELDHVPLEIVFSVAEEQFSAGADALDVTKIKAPFGLVVDGANAGEIDYVAPYIATMNVQITGKAAHSGVEPEAGISAIQIASRAVHHMKLGRIDHETTANVGIMNGGTNRNAIPDFVEIIGEVRSISKRKLEEQLERMHKALEDSAEKFGGLLAIDSRVAVIGYEFSKTDPDITRIAEVMSSVGLQPDLRRAGGGSDANVFVRKGIKTIDVGTGVQKPHTVEEHININDMVAVTRFLVEMVKV